jgi:hypothetical protein
MYCSHCGSLGGNDLNYCKNCGMRNDRNPLIVGNSSSRPLMFSATAIGMVGLIGFFPVLKELLHSGVDPTVMVILLIAYLATVFLMFSVLVGHVWKNSGDIRIKGGLQAEQDTTQQYLRPITTAQLEEPRDFPGSVTEHTTRTLDEVPIRQR